MEFACFVCGSQESLWKNLDKICVTKCGHTFHPDCMKKQLNSMVTFSASETIFCPVSSCKKIMKQNQIVSINRNFVENHYRLRKNKPVICSLCEEPLGNPADMGVTRCGHIYHYRCICLLVRRRSQACLVESCQKNVTLSSITQVIGLIKPSNRSGSEDRIELKNEKCTDNKQFQQTTDITQSKGVKDVSSKPSGSGAGIELRIERCIKSGLPLQTAESRSNSPILCKKGTKHKKVMFDDDIEFVKKRFKMASSTGEVDSHCLSEEKLKKHSVKGGNNELDELKRKFEELEEKKNAITKDYEKAKADLRLWDLSYKNLENMSDEQTRNIAAENVRLKNDKKQLEKQLSDIKRDDKSVDTLRTDLEKALKENTELKSINEELKRDLNEVKDDMKTMDEMIMECKESHMQEKKQLNEIINSLTIKNTHMKKRNETLLIENNKLKKIVKTFTKVVNDVPQKNRPQSSEHNETVFTENNKQNGLNKIQQNNNLVINEQNHNFNLNELNKTLQDEFKSLNEVNKTLLEDNNDLNVLNESLQTENQTLQNENDKLNDVNESLDKDNNDLKLLNEALRNKNIRPIETLLNENDKLNNVNKTQQNENNELNNVDETLIKDVNDINVLNKPLQIDIIKSNDLNVTLKNDNNKSNVDNDTLLENNNLEKNLNESPENKLLENNIEITELGESIHTYKMYELNQEPFENDTNLNVILPEDTIKSNSLNMTCITINIGSNEQNASPEKDNGALGQHSRSEGPSIDFKEANEDERNKIELPSDEGTTQIKINNHNESSQNDTANSKDICNRSTISLDKKKCDSQWEIINRRLSRHSTS